MIRSSLQSLLSAALAGLVLGSLTGCFATRDLASYSEGRASDSSELAASADAPTRSTVAPVDDDVEAPLASREPRPDAGPTLTEALEPSRIDLQPAEAPDTSGASPASCDGEGEFSGAGRGVCYRLLTTSSSWLEGRAECQRWGADLAEVTEPDENELLDARFPEDVWLGASRDGRGGPFAWSSGRPLEYANWGPGQPDDFRGQEDCVVMRPGGLWNDSPCAGPKIGLCERDASQ